MRRFDYPFMSESALLEIPSCAAFESSPSHRTPGSRTQVSICAISQSCPSCRMSLESRPLSFYVRLMFEHLRRGGISLPLPEKGEARPTWHHLTPATPACTNGTIQRRMFEHNSPSMGAYKPHTGTSMNVFISNLPRERITQQYSNSAIYSNTPAMPP